MTSSKPKILEIITIKDHGSYLRTKSKKVVDLTNPNIQKLIDSMLVTVKKKDGLGLAAPQIKKHLQIITVRDDHKTFIVLINPKITHYSKITSFDEEGCLSVPRVYLDVERPVEIIVKAQDRDGHKIEFTAKGMFARIIQHEYDHLQGILFIDK